MFDDKQGPIEHFSWGKFIISGTEHGKTEWGKAGKGKDIRLIGTKVSKWKEREGHKLDTNMITGVFGLNIEVLIIGTGVEGMIDCPKNVRNYITDNGIKKLIIEETPEACEIYNRIYHEGKNVALLAHGTC
jgi:hypothetical protein